MVVFTCNHCGESLKKATVEKHYNTTKCRAGKIFISCMDCLKDFNDQEYVVHTKCISETEKYSGKDYVPKSSLNKGQRKQDAWIDMMRSILVSPDYNLKPVIRTVFERLQAYENVPRKRAKFENFVTNSFKINKNLTPEVWGILEKEEIKMKNNRKPKENTTNGELNDAKENGSDSKETEAKSKITENGSTDGADADSGEEKIKKKSKKRKLEDTVTVNETEKDENVLVENGVSPEKKKKKKNVQDVLNNENLNFTENGDEYKKNEVIAAVESNGTINETDGEFDWFVTISKNAKEGSTIEKLQKKVLKKYKKFLNIEEFENVNKVEKTFKKYLKKSGLNIENNFVKPVA